ncbi:ATP-binding cassette domain-containing protein [Mycoplasmopsis felis]|nr:ATP-binding cassette domain-containing protein [Mycoplasmopsis felis]UWV84177.1 ATP-binding cassette domain-containing protein [Mycoplasmopsis felis]
MNRDHGKQILSVENLTYINENNEILFENVSFTLRPGEKMVIVGEDDIAKTRLLECIMGIKKPASGTIEWGQTITPSYFPNDNTKYFQTSENILEWISKWPLENKEKENQENDDARWEVFLEECYSAMILSLKKLM